MAVLEGVVNEASVVCIPQYIIITCVSKKSLYTRQNEVNRINVQRSSGPLQGTQRLHASQTSSAIYKKKGRHT